MKLIKITLFLNLGLISQAVNLSADKYRTDNKAQSLTEMNTEAQNKANTQVNNFSQAQTTTQSET